MSVCITNAIHGIWIPAVHAGMTALRFVLISTYHGRHLILIDKHKSYQ